MFVFKETYFGEYTDSSDNDSAQHRTSAASMSEDDTPEAQGCASLSGRSPGSGTRREQPGSHGAAQVLNALEGNKATAVGFGTLTATLREPSATYSLAREKLWTVSSPVPSDRKRGVCDESQGQSEAGERGELVQDEGAPRKALGRASTPEWPGSLARQEAALGMSDVRYSPIGRRPFPELLGPEGRAPLPKMVGSPSSDFVKWTPANEITCESGRVSVSGHLRGLSGELEKEGEDVHGFSAVECPGPEEDAGDVTGAAGLDADTSFSSSSTSGVLSVCSNAPSSSALTCAAEMDIPAEVSPAEVSPAEGHHAEQTLQARPSSVSGLPSEPPECPTGEEEPGSGARAVCPELGTPDFRDQGSREVECPEVVEGVTRVCALPQSVFVKATKGGQCERQGLEVELPPSQSGFTALVESQSGLIKHVFGRVQSTSWHQSDLSGRGGEERLRAQSEREQETHHVLQKAVPPLENRGSVSRPGLAAESTSPVALRAAAALLPNQVSVITKQARPERPPSARPEPLGLPWSEPTPATESVDHGTGSVASTARCADGEDTAEKIQEAAPMERTSPTVSTSQRKSESDSPGCPLSVENPHCSTNSKLSFLSENIPVQNEDPAEPAVQEEGRTQSPHVSATHLDSAGTGVGELPATAVAEPEGCPVAEMPCGDGGVPGGATPARVEDTPHEQPGPGEPLQPQPQSQTPAPATPALSPATGREDEEPHALPQGGLPDPLCCYTGIREVGGGETELESDAPSCSEGESESEAVPGSPRPGVAEAPGAVGAGAAEPRPSTEVGCLTSALREFTISALSEIDRLSTSEVVQFLESCQLRDYSSGDSVSESSSKETINREMNKELKQSEMSGEKCSQQPCEQEALEPCEEWVESEEEDGPLTSASQLTACSLETLSEVLSKIGQELQSSCEDSDGNDVANLLLFSVQDSMASEPGKEPAPTLETSSSLPSDPPPPTTSLDAKGASPASGTSRNEDTQSRPEGTSDAAGPVDGGVETPSEPVEPPLQGCDSAAGQTAKHSAACEAEGTFQCQISTVTSEVINVLLNKDQNLVIEKGDNWTIINGVALMPDVDQVILCDAPADVPGSPDGVGLGDGFLSLPSVDRSPETSQTGSPFQEPLCGSSLACVQEEIASSGQSSNFDKSRLRNRPVKPSVRINSEIYGQLFESQTVASDHTYYNSKLEPCGKNKPRSKISSKDQPGKPAKSSVSGRVEASPSEACQSPSGDRGPTKAQRPPPQTVLASADTSTPPDGAADALSRIRREVGPPLPPLLAPLVATPPRTSRPVSPLISSSSPASPTSPVGQLSPPCDVAAPPVVSPLLEEPRPTSPSAAPAGERVLSSPLQFCAATPKHAVPVPGRLPPCASSAHTAVAGPQENSVKILDTMYPELSARARTLSILKGNIQLARGPPADRQNLPGPVSAITGFKAITSTSTAFVKTGGSSGGDCSQDKSRDVGTQQDSGGKRTLSACTPRSAKRLRLDSGSSDPETGNATMEGASTHPRRDLPQADGSATDEEPAPVLAASMVSQPPLNPKETVESHDRAIADALKKIAESSFDLLPVIRSHVYVGNISKKPVMRDEEKEVVYVFSTAKKVGDCSSQGLGIGRLLWPQGRGPGRSVRLHLDSYPCNQSGLFLARISYI